MNSRFVNIQVEVEVEVETWFCIFHLCNRAQNDLYVHPESLKFGMSPTWNEWLMSPIVILNNKYIQENYDLLEDNSQREDEMKLI